MNSVLTLVLSASILEILKIGVNDFGIGELSSSISTASSCLSFNFYRFLNYILLNFDNKSRLIKDLSL